MKSFTRKAAVIWLNTRQNGRGAITTPSAVLKDTPYVTRRCNEHGRGTAPPELIAAAHAGSFSMTLANQLVEAGYRPHRIETTATVIMEHMDGAWTVNQIHLDVIATVPGAAQCNFIDATLRAKKSCPISRLLNANISMRAKLNRRAATPRIFPHTSAAGFDSNSKSNEETKT